MPFGPRGEFRSVEALIEALPAMRFATHLHQRRGDGQRPELSDLGACGRGQSARGTRTPDPNDSLHPGNVGLEDEGPDGQHRA